jgi:HAD superfamily hydrolase (TIGR01509 family)
MIRAVIFDMDGVIIDSEKHWDDFKEMFYPSVVPGVDWASEGKRFVGMNLNNIFDHLKSDFNISMEREEFVQTYNRMARIIYTEKANLSPHLASLLEGLKEADLKLAVASSSPVPWIDMVMDRFDLRDYFERIISADHIGNRGKPFPDIFLHSAKLLGRNPSECVVIEDSINGIIAAKRAGMICIAVRNTSNRDLDLSRADIAINDFSEISADQIKQLQSFEKA